jgi:hypothetical protein
VATALRGFPTLNPQPSTLNHYSPPQFWQAHRLHMVVGRGGHFAAHRVATALRGHPEFSFFFVSIRCAFMAKTPENKGFSCPKNVQKNLKKKVDFPLLVCDIRSTHGNNRTKKQEKYEN